MRPEDDVGMQYGVARWALLTVGLVACSPSGSDTSASGYGGSGAGSASSDGSGGSASGSRAAGDGGAGVGGRGAGSAGEGGSSSTGMVEVDDFEAGGDRPVTVHVPGSFDGEPAPLLILLHGYASSGALAEAYFALGDAAEAQGVITAAPDGLMDVTTSRYWNATAACCDNYDNQPDDVGYLSGLIDEIATRIEIDPRRVYLLGHSNGGFMAYRMACDEASRIAAIVSLSGATELDAADCAPSEPVSILEIHGTSDTVVPYLGGFIGLEAFPSATQTAATWAAYDGCDETPTRSAFAEDIVAPVGVDSDADRYDGCDAESSVELWTVQGGLHQPLLAADFGEQVLRFLMAHPKP